jgi:hypothetical protein
MRFARGDPLLPRAVYFRTRSDIYTGANGLMVNRAAHRGKLNCAYVSARRARERTERGAKFPAAGGSNLLPVARHYLFCGVAKRAGSRSRCRLSACGCGAAGAEASARFQTGLNGGTACEGPGNEPDCRATPRVGHADERGPQWGLANVAHGTRILRQHDRRAGQPWICDLTREKVWAGSRLVDVGKVRITAAGRDALAAEG